MRGRGGTYPDNLESIFRTLGAKKMVHPPMRWLWLTPTHTILILFSRMRCDRLLGHSLCSGSACEKERERERERRESRYNRNRERECVNMHAFVRRWMRMSVSDYVRVLMHMHICLCVRVCVWEREMNVLIWIRDGRWADDFNLSFFFFIFKKKFLFEILHFLFSRKKWREKDDKVWAWKSKLPNY